MKRFFVFGAMLLCAVLSAWAQFSGQGSGTTTDPYRITNAVQLSQMANFLNDANVVFQLENDIDLTEWIEENSPRQGWQPIGVSSSPFKGQLLGQNHTISGLTINRPTEYGVGFFGRMEDATVKDLVIESGELKAACFLAPLAGYATDCIISNITIKVQGDVISVATTGHMDYAVAGMVCDALESLTMKDCHVYINGSLKSVGTIGGLIALLPSGSGLTSITSCFVEGNISFDSSRPVGGLIGESRRAISVKDCHVRGNITGNDYVGGFIGLCEGGSASIQESSYTGDVTGKNYVGGLIGGTTENTEDPHLYEYTWYCSKATTYEAESGGGIADRMIYANDLPNVIGNCAVVGTIKGNDYVGGLIGCDKQSFTLSKTTWQASYYAGSRNINGTMVDYVTTVYKDGVYLTSAKGRCYFTVTDYTRQLMYLKVLNNTVSGAVEGTSNVGGIVGYKMGGTLQNNLANVTVCGESSLGGIVGTVTSVSSINIKAVTDIKGNVAANPMLKSTSSSLPGRVIGSIVSSTNLTIGSNGSSNANRALATMQLFVKAEGNVDVEKYVDDSNVHGMGTGISTLRMMDNYKAWGWDFYNDWAITDGKTFPYKQYQTAPPIVDGKLTGNATTIAGTCVSEGSTVYLYYNGQSAPVSTKCTNGKFVFNTERLQEESIIYLYADNEMVPSYTMTVKVGKDNNIYVTNVELSQTSIVIEENQTYQLEAVITPENATNKAVTWTSSDEQVATVDEEGLVTAVGVGTSTITCVANDGSGISATCVVTVEAAPTALKGDLTGDGQVNGTDLVALANMVLGKMDKTDAADLTGDGQVNGTDYVYLVNMVLGKASSRRKVEANAVASLSFEDFDIKAGETKELVIDLDNPNDEITLVQFDLRLPEGLSVNTVDGEYDMDIAGRTTWRKHSLDANATDGIVRFLLSSSTNALITGTSGAIITIKIKADDDFQRGTIRMENILMVSPDLKETKQDAIEYQVGGGETPDVATATLSVEQPFNILAGETKVMTIDLNNPNDAITLVQFDLRLPEGLSVNTVNGEYDIDIADRTTWRKHSLDANATDGIVRFLLSSSTNALITGTSGAVIKIGLKADATFSTGDISLENILLVSPDLKENKPADVVVSVGTSTPTDIREVRAEKEQSVYSLSGQRWNAPKKGINIINGRKVVIR
ncbi:MAG: Ig-like domain-containing protein [Prevotella sp.]|nr:Ig-like domain-containing protein [Prevotella sp.]